MQPGQCPSGWRRVVIVRSLGRNGRKATTAPGRALTKMLTRWACDMVAASSVGDGLWAGVFAKRRMLMHLEASLKPVR